ncbi:hypothetical protein KEM52_002154 [Ascosphaera acerosa]|nr:hypothetical protein KEM52_002154 [Ascosphaera acerosa]
MHLLPLLLATAGLAATARAHFELIYPPPRGKNTEKMTTGPCGGFSRASANRTRVSLADGAVSVALDMHHDRTIVEVLLGLGEDAGTTDGAAGSAAFDVKLVPAFQLQGLGAFCLPRVDLEARGVKIVEGTNATLQVVTNGDPSGGLYSVGTPVPPSPLPL